MCEHLDQRGYHVSAPAERGADVYLARRFLSRLLREQARDERPRLVQEVVDNVRAVVRHGQRERSD